MKTSFLFAWFGNMAILFRNQESGAEYELRLLPHDEPEGTIVRNTTLSSQSGVLGDVYHTHTLSFQIDRDFCVLVLSYLTGLSPETIELIKPGRLP